MKLLIENLLMTPQVKLTSDEANCKSGCNFKDKWTNGIMEYSIFNCTARGLINYTSAWIEQTVDPRALH